MSSPATKKHKCKVCPFWHWILMTEENTCCYNSEYVVMPHGNCRCRFGKEWFRKNILKEEN